MLSFMPPTRHQLSTYAVTLSTFQQHRHFQKTSNAELFISLLFQHREKNRFLLHGFAVMPDHVHVLITPSIQHSTAICIQFLKGGYSFALKQPKKYPVWKDGHFTHRIRDVEDFRTQLLYIANNPAKKNYESYPHVHSNFAGHLDPEPSHLSV